MRRAMARFGWIAYDVLVGLAVWIALAPAAFLESIAGRAASGELWERLGRVRMRPPSGTRVLVHAVSAGEMTAAAAFVAALAAARPSWRVVLSCGTRDGRTRAEQLSQQFSSVEAICFLPWDRARAVSRWLRWVQPSAVVVVEPEFWPNLYRACGRLAIPLAVVNARVYPRDVVRYRLVRSFMRESLGVPVTFAARAGSDVEMLEAIGVPRDRIIVAGDLKADAAAWPSLHCSSADVGGARDGRPLLVAGSTHPPEEDLLLDMLGRVRASCPTLRLALAPRDVGRASGIAAACGRRGYRSARATTAHDTAAGWDVLILDRVGLLPQFYRVADLAFIGGTLARRGGHNVLEPAVAGCATIVGPHVDDVRHHVEPLEACGGIVRLGTGPNELAAAVADLLREADVRTRLARRARDYVLRHSGAARRCTELVLRAVEGSAPARPALTADARSHATATTWPRGASAAPSPGAGVALRPDVERS
jgi:3-deoxy-D-manno-octulosonic-acid transferase